MKLSHILSALWCEPWLILPEMHRQLCAIAEAHFTGTAHKPGGIAGLFEENEDEDNRPTMTVVEGVGIIPIEGTIGKRVSSLARSSGVTDVDDIEALLVQAESRQDVQAILLDINSPGGTTTGVPELAARIVKAEKPVVSFADKLAASAAYWIAAAADKFVSTESAMVGSVGVYMAWLDVSRAFEAEGYRTELIKHGKFKAMGLQGTTLSPEQRAHLQAQVDEIYNWFAGFVRVQRVVKPEALEGQTFFGAQAAGLGLVDSVGTRDEAIGEALGLYVQGMQRGVR